MAPQITIPLQIRAQQLKRQFERRHEDRNFERNGGSILYALDNDVITVVTAPWNCKHQTYLTHLIDGDDEAQESLAYIFAEYFLRHDATLRPLPFVIVSPGDIELEGLWNSIYLAAHRENVSLRDDFDAFRKRLDDSNLHATHKAQDAIRFVRELLGILHRRRGAIAQLQRIIRIQSSENILPVDRMVAHDEALVPTPDDAGERDIAKTKDFWLTKLNEIRPPRSRVEAESAASGSGVAGDYPTNNSIDAAVMARIEWINNYFESEMPGRRRLCFITGDRHIERIARKRLHGNSNVAECYVRNPSCFLADWEFFALAGVRTPDFLAAVGNGQTPGAGELAPRVQEGGSLRDWVHVLFPESPTTSSGISQQAIEIEVQEAVGQWASYLKLAAADAGIREANTEFEEHVNELVGAGQFRLKVEELVRQVLALGNDAMTRFGVAGVLAGFSSLDPTHRWSDRTIPALKFESFPVATELIGEILVASDLKQAQATLARERINLLRKEDATGYTVFASFALAFAHASEWESALTVARAALSVASNYDRSEITSEVKGDEAAYLCAVFSRYCAREPSDLQQCERWLAVAQERQLAQPWRRSIRELQDPTGYRDPRFLAEELAIALARTNFSAFLQPDASPGMHEQLLALSIKSLGERHLALLASLESEPSERIAHSLQQQLATNFLQLTLLGRYKGIANPSMDDEAARMVRLLSNSGETPMVAAAERRFSRKWPTLVEFTFLCSSALYLPAAAGWHRKEHREALLAHVLAAGKRLRVMPYDPLRATAFSDMVRVKLASME